MTYGAKVDDLTVAPSNRSSVRHSPPGHFPLTQTLNLTLTLTLTLILTLLTLTVLTLKASHTRYRALGLKLIPVYRQSARR